MDEVKNEGASSTGINYRTDHAERELERKRRSVNEDTNKARGRAKAEIKDATAGNVKERGELQSKKLPDKPSGELKSHTSRKPFLPTTNDLHLRGTTSLTPPEAASQKLKPVTKPLVPRGGGGILPFKEDIFHQHSPVLQNDLLSKKDEKPQIRQEHQQQQSAHATVVNPAKPLSARERTNKAIEAKAGSINLEKTAQVNKEISQLSVKERVARAAAEKTALPKEKPTQLAIAKVKPLSQNIIKR